MNDTKTNAGGWAESGLRKWLQKDYLAMLPQELQDSIVTVQKTYVVNNDEVNGATRHKTAEDTLWIPSVREINPRDVANEKAGAQYYDYFTDGTLLARLNKYDLSGNTSTWWLRSSGDNPNFGQFLQVLCLPAWNQINTEQRGNADTPSGVVIGFCM